MFPRLRGRGSCSRLHRQVTAPCSSIPASTSRASRGIAWDHGRWLPAVNRVVVGRPGWRSARHPRPVVRRQLLRAGGRSSHHLRPVVRRQLLRPAGRTARHPRPVSLLASGSWPRGSGPAWDWPSSGLGVGPGPTSRAVYDVALASVVWPGGLPCPWTRGTVDAVACRETTGGKQWSLRSRPDWTKRRPWPAQVPGWSVGRLRLGVEHASTVRPDPSTLGGGRTRLPREGRLWTA
jgi:hypothetical protein